ncbi:MAG: hypothetical protein JWN15_3949 [Firmicutes bacterium]|nr:hypothetical protein [Bacillota bacterium]
MRQRWPPLCGGIGAGNRCSRSGSGGYQSRVFPVRVQFIHMQGESGWVRAQGLAWPL